MQHSCTSALLWHSFYTDSPSSESLIAASQQSASWAVRATVWQLAY